MIEAYEKYNYQVIIVPKVSIEERIQFILKHIE
jgi:predicted ATPase